MVTGSSPLFESQQQEAAVLFWVISGVALAVVLLGAWLYDRHYGVDHTRMPSDLDRARAAADASVSERQADITGL